MARRLTTDFLLLGLTLFTAVASAPPISAQSAPQRPSDTSPDDPSKDSKSDGKNHRDSKRGDRRHDGEKHDGEKGDAGKRDNQRGNGPRPDFWEMMKQPDFLIEIVKRDGGSLELLAPLMKQEVRDQLKLEPARVAAVDKFFADMVRHVTEDIEQNRAKPETNWAEVFKNRWEAENKDFDKLLKTELTQAQLDRLIGIFVQYRNMRALTNRVVAIEKLGMSIEESDKLRADVRRIRSETLNDNEAFSRRQMESGTVVQQTEQLRKVRSKIDGRIEKLLTKEQMEKLRALRGEPLPTELLESLDRPPGPPPKKN